MKRFLLFAAACLLSLGIQAQNEPQTYWWGYVNNDTEKTGLGVKAADTYHCAIFIPGNHAVAAGKTIKAVRFGLVAQNATDTKVWLASSLPSAINESTSVITLNVVSSNASPILCSTLKLLSASIWEITICLPGVGTKGSSE